MVVRGWKNFTSLSNIILAVFSFGLHDFGRHDVSETHMSLGWFLEDDIFKGFVFVCNWRWSCGPWVLMGRLEQKSERLNLKTPILLIYLKFDKYLEKFPDSFPQSSISSDGIRLLSDLDLKSPWYICRLPAAFKIPSYSLEKKFTLIKKKLWKSKKAAS